jgi:hypothetical protein
VSTETVACKFAYLPLICLCLWFPFAFTPTVVFCFSLKKAKLLQLIFKREAVVFKTHKHTVTINDRKFNVTKEVEKGINMALNGIWNLHRLSRQITEGK